MLIEDCRTDVSQWSSHMGVETGPIVLDRNNVASGLDKVYNPHQQNHLSSGLQAVIDQQYFNQHRSSCAPNYAQQALPQASLISSIGARPTISFEGDERGISHHNYLSEQRTSPPYKNDDFAYSRNPQVGSFGGEHPQARSGTFGGIPVTRPVALQPIQSEFKESTNINLHDNSHKPSLQGQKHGANLQYHYEPAVEPTEILSAHTKKPRNRQDEVHETDHPPINNSHFSILSRDSGHESSKTPEPDQVR